MACGTLRWMLLLLLQPFSVCRPTFRKPVVVLLAATIAAASAASHHASTTTGRIAFAHLGYVPIQLASAVATYVGLVSLLDRPRGTLVVRPDAIRVAPSQVQGLGLYVAATSIPKGTVLGTYPGTVIPMEQNLVKLRDHPRCEAYVWRFSDSKVLIDPTDAFGKLQERTYGGNPSTFASFWICRNLIPFLSQPTTLCRINEPPIGYDVNVYTEEDLGSRRITFILERDVLQGEELFIDYGLNYDRTSYGNS